MEELERAGPGQRAGCWPQMTAAQGVVSGAPAKRSATDMAAGSVTATRSLSMPISAGCVSISLSCPIRHWIHPRVVRLEAQAVVFTRSCASSVKIVLMPGVFPLILYCSAIGVRPSTVVAEEPPVCVWSRSPCSASALRPLIDPDDNCWLLRAIILQASAAPGHIGHLKRANRLATSHYCWNRSSHWI